MTDELVKRLRDFDPHMMHEWEVTDEAADRIEALTAEHNATLARLAGAVAREIALLAEREELVECNEQFSVDNQFLKKRAEKGETERDAAYASGYSDAETEISKSALGQRNDFLLSQYVNAAACIKDLTAERDRLREMVQASVSFMNGDLTAEEWNEVCMRPWQPPALKGETP